MAYVKRKEKIGVDKLRICFTHNDEAFNKTIASKDKIVWWGSDNQENFHTRLDSEDSDDRTLSLKIFIPEDKGTKLFGTLKITKVEAKRYGGKAFLSIENDSFYNGYTHYITYIVDTMDLVWNNITHLDIALTSTVNYINRVLHPVRNFEGIRMMYNGKEVKDPEATLTGFMEIHGRSRQRKYNNPTLVFGHKKPTGLKVKIYDKKRELKEASPQKKELLNSWLGFEYTQLFRVEVTISNGEMRKLCTNTQEYLDVWDHSENVLNLINLNPFLETMFCMALNRVLHFKKGNEVTNIWD